MAETKKAPTKRPTAADKKLKELYKRVDVLEAAIAKMAHFNGNDSILREFGLKTWKVQREDMTRWKK